MQLGDAVVPEGFEGHRGAGKWEVPVLPAAGAPGRGDDELAVLRGTVEVLLEEREKKVKQVFDKYDNDKSGSIDQAELTTLMEELGLLEELGLVEEPGQVGLALEARLEGLPRQGSPPTEARGTWGSSAVEGGSCGFQKHYSCRQLVCSLVCKE